MLLRLNIHILIILISSFSISKGLHFYLKSGQVKCFYENLSPGNLMIGDINGYVQKEDEFIEDPQLRLSVSVDELCDSNHRAMNQNDSHVGNFAFTALGNGEHRICIMPSYPREGARLGIFLDLEITDIRVLDKKGENDQGRLRQRLLQLTQRLEGILLLQRVIKEEEMVFRNQSEHAYSKILRWSYVHILGLTVICIFHLRYLKNCFVKEKAI